MTLAHKSNRIITDTQLKFLNWVYENHSIDLKSGILYGALKTAVTDSKRKREMGYDEGSPFANVLNDIRDMYLTEYLNNR